MPRSAKVEEIKKFIRGEISKGTIKNNNPKIAYLISKNLLMDKDIILSEAKFLKVWNELLQTDFKVEKHNSVMAKITGDESKAPSNTLNDVDKKIEAMLVVIVEKEFKEKVVPVIKQLINDKADQNLELKIREILIKILSK